MLLTSLAYTTFLLFSLGQLGRISLAGQQVNFYLYEVCLYLTLGAYLFKYRLDPIVNNFKNWKIIYLFIGSLMLSFLASLSGFNFQENIISFLYLVRLAGLFLYFIYSNHHIKRNNMFKKKLFQAVMLFLLITILISLLQYFFYPNLRNLSYLGWDPHQFRLFGVFFDESVAAAIFGLLFLFIFLSSSQFGKHKIQRIVLLIVYLLFAAQSFSRGMYVSLVTTLLIYLLLRKEIKKLLLIFTIFVLLVFIIPKPFGEGVNLLRTATVQSRIKDYSTAISLWKKSPIIGIGYNRIRYVKKKENIGDLISTDTTHSGASFHSSYLVVLITGGILALLLFFGSIIKLASLSNSAKFYVLFLSTFSFFDNVFLHPFVLFLLLNLLFLL